MLFNSFEFVVFFPIVFLIYWHLPRRPQTAFLLAASYLFYGWWDWRFLALIILSSLVDYLVGLGLERSSEQRDRRLLLAASLFVNLGALGVFKYYGFFVAQFADVIASLGAEPHLPTLKIVLPVGISFYTFQTLSYSIDVYRRKISAHHDVLEFFTFVAFFPQLVAGPIERARNLLPQFARPRVFNTDKAWNGLHQVMWGLLKKVVIADTLASVVDQAYGSADATGTQLALGTFFFAFQIYCDFSGYSDIAIGTAKMLGIDLMENFATPYFARSIHEFWERWHISLSTWFRDYVYIPLGGRRVSRERWALNIFVTFVVSGLWHGANWTFLVWGACHGVLYLLTLPLRTRRDEVSVSLVGRAGQIALTFSLVLVTWVFFRADSIEHAGRVFVAITTDTELFELLRWGLRYKLLIGVLLAIEWLQQDRPHPLEARSWPLVARAGLYYGFAVIVLLLGRFSYEPFIYFQF